MIVAGPATAISRWLPVRVPTRRGLLGFRLLLIRRQRQSEFRNIRSLDELRRFSIGQGFAWSDAEILRSQGLRVETGSYEGLFRMLAAGRFDCYPRGINEVFTCVPDASGEMGVYGDPCEYINVCDPGLFCASAESDASERVSSNARFITCLRRRTCPGR